MIIPCAGAGNRIIAYPHARCGVSADAAEIWRTLADMIAVIGATASVIGAATVVWKIRGDNARRTIEAHARLLNVLEEARKKAADVGLSKTKYPYMFGQSDREWLTACVADPLIADAVRRAYKKSGPMPSSVPGKNRPVTHLANLTELQAAVAEEIGRLKRSGYWRLLMCKGNPARRADHAA